jgi:beta-N-acetylhexosaminidase
VAQGSVEAAGRIYGVMADHLAALGFTANFGPVVDLALNPANPVIARYGRSFGAAPHDVVAFARAFVHAHDEAGVATALKHFPGHGSSTADSHDGAIDLNPTWSRRELIPYRDLIASEDADMVMIGHLMLDGLSGPGGLPASLSPNAIDGFLRETLCFDGLVVSDDLAMDAVADRWGEVDAARQMLAAGGDVILLSVPASGRGDRIDRVIAGLVEQAGKSRRFKDKVRHAYARVVHHKLDRAEAAHRTSRGNAERAPEYAEAR